MLIVVSRTLFRKIKSRYLTLAVLIPLLSWPGLYSSYNKYPPKAIKTPIVVKASNQNTNPANNHINNISTKLHPKAISAE